MLHAGRGSLDLLDAEMSVDPAARPLGNRA